MVLVHPQRRADAVRERLPSAAFRALRPRQWLKNVLVLGAPFTAGALGDPDVLVAASVAFVAFALVSSSVYLANDARDVEQDRRHPTKRSRPIACGALPLPYACVMSAVLCAAALAVGFVQSTALFVTLLVYLVLQVSYSFGLKDEAVLDLAIVASGFLLRAVAGGVAAGITLSPWFLMVASFGSLFMVAGKRFSELSGLGPGSSTRACLQHYSESYLRFVWGLAAGLTVITYTLWALEHGEQDEHLWAMLSIAPFVLALLRYAVDVDRGVAGAPEDIALGDRALQVLGVAWLALVGLAVYA